MKEKEIINKCLDYFIQLCELDEVIRLKNHAVKEQSFELAVKLRDEENKIRGTLPTLVQIKQLREQLNSL